MSKQKKNIKKVNKLKFSECNEILQKLDFQKDSKYYHAVLSRFKSLLPTQVPHKPKNKD